MKMMKYIFVNDYDSKSLTPISRARAHKLFKNGRVEIFEYRPFTIRLL